MDTTTVTFPVELRTAEEGDERIVEGIVVPYNETSFLTPDPKGERFLPGSLDRTVTEKASSIKLFRNHDHARAVGRAVEWRPDHDQGLWGKFRIPHDPQYDDVWSEIRNGMLDAFSVGFRPIRSRRGADGAREITEAALHEASIAPLAAYEGAQVLAIRTPTVMTLPPMPAVNLEPIRPIIRWAE